MGFPAFDNSDILGCFLVSIPSRGLWVFPRAYRFIEVKGVMFQSLVGVYGFSRDCRESPSIRIPPVSIPSRGLWVFPRGRASRSF